MREREMPLFKEKPSELGFLAILTGPTAAGKTELKERLSGKYSNVNFVVTTTTRIPRLEKGEKDKVDYHFISRKDFSIKIDDGEFIEYAPYDGNLYGTTKAEIEQIFNGENLISAMEMSGAANWNDNIRKVYPKEKAQQIISRTIIMLIDADSDETLRKRSIRRSLGKLGNFEERLLEDKVLMERYGESFLHRIINAEGKIEESMISLESLIGNTFPRNRLISR